MKTCLAFLAVALTVTLNAQSTQQDQAQGRLVVDRLEERTIAGGTPHVWTIDVPEGRYLELTADSVQMDFTVAVLTPTGAGHRTANHRGYAGTRGFRWIAQPGGSWTVKVSAPGKLSGRYQIKLTVDRPATERDRAIDMAEGLIEQAEREDRYDNAEVLLRRALDAIEKTVGSDSVDTASILANLADFYFGMGRYAESCALLERVLAIQQGQLGPDSLEVGTTLNNLGFMNTNQGLYIEAEARLLRARDVRERRLGANHVRVGITLDNLAAVYLRLGRYADAEWSASRAREIFEPQRRDYVPFALSFLTSVYQLQGQYAEAEATIRRALEIDEATAGTSSGDYASRLSTLAANFLLQGRATEAQSLYEQTLVLNRKLFPPDHPVIARNLANLGRTHGLAGQAGASRQFFEQALAIQRARDRAHPDTARTLVGLARAVLATNPADTTEVATWVDEAVAILEASPGNIEVRIQAYALRAQIKRHQGMQDAAVAALEESLRLVESLRPQTSGAEDARAAFFEQYTSHFNRMITWHIEANRLETAFQYIERSRSRVLLDQLAAGQVNLRTSIDPATRTALESRERAVLSRMAELQSRIGFTERRRDVSSEARQTALADLRRELQNADREYQRVYADIKNASDLWRRQITSGGSPVTLAGIQRELVPADGAMLLYHLGHESSHVWLIPPVGQPVAALPLRVNPTIAAALGVAPGEITSAALHKILEGTRLSDAGARPAVRPDSSDRGLQAAGASAANASLHALWQLLVPESLRTRLTAMRQVVIVPDGPLVQFPFEALVMAPPSPSGRVRYWLDDGPVIRYAPSATVLYNLTRNTNRPAVSGAGAFVLSVSDPVYDLDEVERRSEPVSAATQAAETRMRSSFERFGGALVRLPGTARESDAILEAFGNEAEAAVTVLRRLAATEPAVREALRNKRYLHLAAHGLVGGGRADLFASLALTPPAASTTNASADGFLQLHEIYELQLADVELAVLSACNTNRGSSVDGEGVFALSRGFMAAGARRVIASQWAVNDASTAALMSGLFTQVVSAHRAGRPVDYATALRDAKRLVRDRAEWAAPFYWAPFVLMGRQ